MKHSRPESGIPVQNELTQDPEAHCEFRLQTVHVLVMN